MSLHPTGEPAPVLLIPYNWIGDFVRGHSVVKLLRAQSPERPVDILATPLCAPLVDYMPGVRRTIVAELPRRRIALRKQLALSELIEAQNYGRTIVLPRTWKAVLAPFLAGIPVRTGFFGEARFVLLNDLRFGERALPRMIDRMGALALPRNAPLPKEWPLPELVVPPHEIDAWKKRRGLAGEKRPVVTLAPGAVGAGKAWPVSHFAQLARALAADGASIWILGGPHETELAKEIMSLGGNAVRDLTGNDLRDAILALAAADVAVTNDSGLMHVAAAIGAPTVAIFGPTSPWHQKPLNPLAAIVEPPGDDAARERARAQGNDAVAHMRTSDVAVETVLAAVRRVLSENVPKA
ncbi:MAG TPA: lipopolysaccharide heptosyltransferase II [Pseudolabrys sp.]|nr:lipopolysaccharide heptosyltransferase II [Pseudolabrys sp.]